MPARSLSLVCVSKNFGPAIRAVDSASLDVRPGEFVSFLGPSGSGKTTTLMMIAGFTQPTSGHILINGERIDSVPASKRNIGMVFQNYALFPHLDVLGDVGFPLKVRGRPIDEIRRRAQRALEIVNLQGYDERFPRQLSGGQQQRVALARAIVFEPDLILLDEPLGALDKGLREQMQLELKRLHRELGITMIYVTHDQSEAMTMSDRIAVFQKGRIEQLGAPGEVYSSPSTRFVASFVGDSNLLEGTVDSDGTVHVPDFGPIQVYQPPAAGTSVTVMIRPEAIKLQPQTAVTSTSNQIRIREIVHYGDSVLVLGENGTTKLRVRVRPHDLPDNAVGQLCGVTWTGIRPHVII